MIEPIYNISMVVSLIALILIVSALVAGRFQHSGISWGFTLFVIAWASWAIIMWGLYALAYTFFQPV